jgi:GNAT superfamily N-acetyltransferase
MCVPHISFAFLGTYANPYVSSQLFPQYGALTTSALGEGAKKASWHLQQFSVLPEYHRRGLGKALVEVVEKQVRLLKDYTMRGVPNIEHRLRKRRRSLASRLRRSLMCGILVLLQLES